MPWLSGLGNLEEEPDAALGLVQNLLEDVAGRAVALLFGEVDRLADIRRDLLVVFQKALNHLVGGYERVVVIRDGLGFADVRDAANGGAANLRAARSGSHRALPAGR